MLISDGWKVESVNPVEVIDWMGNDNAICDAARVSFHKKAEMFSVDKNASLLEYLARHDHWSPFAHGMLKFRFRAPIFIARQFQKHTVGFAWNEVSRRYVDDDPTFWVPKTLRKRPPNMKQGSVAEGEIDVTGQVFLNIVEPYADAVREYRDMLKTGICPEQARAFLPQSMMTEWIWTGSLQAWSRFVKLRADDHAQAECHEFAHAVRQSMYDYFPLATNALMENY